MPPRIPQESEPVSDDYYDILGIPRNATDKEIKAAFRSLARKYHPDVCRERGAEEKFKKINEAYSVLSDPQKRARYDMGGKSAFEGASPFGGGFGGFHTDYYDFGDIFDAFFGGFGERSRQRQGPIPGADILIRLRISLEEAVFGADKDVEVDHTEACPACDATGSVSKRLRPCPTCGGSGQVRHVHATVLGQFIRAAPCGACRGRGRVAETPCTQCRGTGHVQARKKVRVHVPAGIDTGMRLRVGGLGEAGEMGAPSGDLFIEVSVAPHRRFSRAGDHLETTIEITPAQAAIGSSATVETIDRKQVEVQIPEGTEQDAVLTVPGEGVRKKGRSGDLRVRVKIRTPRHLSAEERDLYQKLLQLEGKKKPKRKGLFGHLRG